MIYDERGMVKMEKDEPALRSCWECNPAHDYLRRVNILHVCFDCGKYWIFDKFLCSFYDRTTEEEGNKKMVEWFKSKGIYPGESSSKIDADYKIFISGDGKEK